MLVSSLLFFSILSAALSSSPVRGAENENNDSALFFQGHDLMKKRQPQKAAPLFEEVLAKFPQSKIRDLTYFWLGRAYLETRQTEKSRETLSQLRKEFPDSPLARKLEGLIASRGREPNVLSKEGASQKGPKPAEKKEPPAPPPSQKAPAASKNPPGEKPAPSPPSSKPAEGFLLVIPQVADLKVTPASDEKKGYPGEEVEFPIAVTNRGNGEDSFTLDSTFPIEYRPAFFAGEEGKSKEEIQSTPALAPDQSFHALLRVRLPAQLTDGQSKTFEIKVASRFDRNSFQWIRKTVTASAPLLQGEYHADRERVRPGEEIRYTILLGNNGSSEAREVRVRYSYHPALIFLSSQPAPEKVESAGRAVYWSLSGIRPQGSEKIEVVFKVGDETAAGQQILNRGAFFASVGGETPFLSPPVSVTQVASVRLDGLKDELRVTSGDPVYLPFVLTNFGNGPDQFSLKGEGLPADQMTLYYDRNQDGLYQTGEPVISETPLLGARENFSILVGVKVPPGRDGEKIEVRLDARSSRDGRTTAVAARSLLLSLPVVVVQTQLQSRDNLPGGVISYQETVMNTGSGLAKGVAVTEVLPPELEFVHADPDPAQVDGRKLVWNLNELGPQQKRVFSVSLRIRKGLLAGTVVKKRTEIRYQDLHGNVYP